jgi:hypothetical protein
MTTPLLSPVAPVEDAVSRVHECFANEPCERGGRGIGDKRDGEQRGKRRIEIDEITRVPDRAARTFPI